MAYSERMLLRLHTVVETPEFASAARRILTESERIELIGFLAANPTEPIARRADQVQWRDPASGYVRRNVSPGGFASPIRIVEVEFPAGARVAFDTGARDVRVHQQVWVLEGAIDVWVGDERHQLRTGDCFAFVLDRPTAFHNRTRKIARYAVVVVSQPGRVR